MKKIKTKFKDLLIFESKIYYDQRGNVRESFKKNLIKSNLFLSVVSKSKKNVIRGLHFQSKNTQDKFISVVKGKILDVVVDLRKNSKTYKKWFGVILDSDKYTQLYIPEGIAHGFQTLEDNSDIFYQISEYHQPEHYNAVRWNDPMFNIHWPLQVSCISKKDANLNDFKL